jgi:hypothetical protein
MDANDIISKEIGAKFRPDALATAASDCFVTTFLAMTGRTERSQAEVRKVGSRDRKVGTAPYFSVKNRELSLLSRELPSLSVGMAGAAEGG